MNETKTVSGLENLAFSITRWFILGGATVVMLAILALGVALLLSFGSEKVSYSEIVKKLGKEASSTSSNASNSQDFLVPFPENVKSSDKNDMIIRDWIKGFSKQEQEEFLSNLSSIISKAESQGVHTKPDVVNAFHDLKMQKLSQSEPEKYMTLAVRGAYVVGIFGCLVILTLFSLVLVMLAVERNTRILTRFGSADVEVVSN